MIAASAIERARAVPIEDEIDRRNIKLRGTVERVGPSPRCGGTDRFSINIRKQVWNCRQCAKGGKVFDLVMHVDDCTFAEAIETLAGGKIERPQVNQEPPRKRRTDDRWMLTLANRIWKETEDLPAFVVDWIAERRGFDIDDVPDHGGLRWHPECPWGTGTKPCIVARYTDTITNEQKGIWRRPLTGEKPMTLGACGGCVIRLWPDDAVTQGLVLGEGVETTLAAATLIHHNNTLLQPAWAAGSRGNMGKFPVLNGIEALTILVDNDANGAGQQDAAECRDRWIAAGREVEMLAPTRFKDFNDVTRAWGPRR